MTVINLPFPVSVNAMFSDGKTRRHKSQRYADWVLEAGYRLNRQAPIPVTGPVKLSYELQEGRDNRRRDLSNHVKAVEDLLVAHGVIEADHDLVVRGFSMDWNREVEGIRVTIHRVQPTQTESAAT